MLKEVLTSKKDGDDFIERKNQKNAILSAFILGMVLGLFAKLVDNPSITSVFPLLDDIGGRLGIWIFFAIILSVHSDSPKIAAFRVFAFFLAMLLVYYLYTILFLGFFPVSQIIFWSICAIISPICAFSCWFINQKGVIADIYIASAIAILGAEIYVTGKGNFQLQIVYGCFMVALLILLPYRKRQLLLILFISCILFFLLIKTEILVVIFGNWML